MLIILLGGLLLVAVQHGAHSFPLTNSHYGSPFSNDDSARFGSSIEDGIEELPSLDWHNPWLLLASNYRSARPHRFNPSSSNDFYWTNDRSNQPTSGSGTDMEQPAESRDDLLNNGENLESTYRLLTYEDNRKAMEKRDSYLSMCHFKICNLGRKRRIAQSSPGSPSIG